MSIIADNEVKSHAQLIRNHSMRIKTWLIRPIRMEQNDEMERFINQPCTDNSLRQNREP